MFHSANKTKPLAQVLRDGNSRNRFFNELSKNENKLFNRSLDSAQTAPLEKKPSFTQTKLCVRRSIKRPFDPQNDTFTTADKMETKTELFIMPMPKMKVLESKVKLNNTICCVNENKNEQPSCSTKAQKELINQRENSENIEQKSATDPLAQAGRNLMVLVGKVDFVLKTSKMYPKINVLWDVYGKLLKISKGKYRYEHILLVRNIEEDGPILQCIYYDFNNTLDMYPNGSNIRIVGHLNGLNRLRAFKLQLLEKTIQQTNLMRIQNVNSFVLLQNQTTE